MITPPFIARIGRDAIWIEDSTGLSICYLNPLLEQPEATRVAELLANGTNFYLDHADRARKRGHKGGRPKLKKPSKLTLAKRKSRAKTPKSSAE